MTKNNQLNLSEKIKRKINKKGSEKLVSAMKKVARKLISDSKPLEPEFQKVIDKHF